MMADPATRKATHDDLYRLPDNMIGEIVSGELIATPRPSRSHALAASLLGGEIIPPYCHGRGGGPGGWVIILKPEISLGADILVPDLAGWKRENYPANEPHNWISVPPDWICEILSPSTARLDKTRKMSIYAARGVAHLWLLDPTARTLDVFHLDAGRWMVVGLFVDGDKVRTEPFSEIEIDISSLFWREEQ
ncbi:MAG: Uma2 family endonuclease [Acidobacteriota bacterium]